LLAASPAFADDAPSASPPPLFGSKGRLVIDDLFGARLGGLTSPVPGMASSALMPTGIVGYTSSEANGMQSTSVYVAPDVDYFVTDQITIGADLTLGYTRQRVDQFATLAGTDSATSAPTYAGSSVESGYVFALRPRVGYVIRLADEIYLWPRLGVGYAMADLTGGGGPVHSHTLSAEADVGLVIALTRHALFDVGPTLGYVASDSDGAPFYPVPQSSTTSKGFGGGAHASLGLVF
jgi:hypothetical protein